MDRYDPGDTHLVFEGISTGIDNKFGLEAVFYGMGFIAYIVVVLLFIDLFFTSITSPIFYGIFAPNKRRRRRSLERLTYRHYYNEIDRKVSNLNGILDAIESFRVSGYPKS